MKGFFNLVKSDFNGWYIIKNLSIKKSPSKAKKSNKKKNIYKKSFIYILISVIIIIIALLNLKTIILIEKKGIQFLKCNSNLKFTYKESKKILNFNKKELIDDYLSPILPIYDDFKQSERNTIEFFLSLKGLSKKINDQINKDIKKELLNKINSIYHRQLTKIDTLYIEESINFGNAYVSINNILYYCEVLGCKNIYLNSQINWFIKDKIVTDKFNISLNTQINCSDPTTLCANLNSNNFWYYLVIIRPEIRLNIIKNEIKRNLPKLIIDEDDLYIHIRVNNHTNYAQPPLCFYKTIINNYNFKNIYIISGIKKSPIINKLISDYSNIICQMNSIEVDLSYLTNAFNLIGSQSSFFEVCVKLNDNLKNLFEYDILKSSEKIFFLHHDFYDYPRKYTIYQMKPSIDYRNKMFVWKMEPKQEQYMLEERCSYNFEIIKPNFYVQYN